MRQFDGCECGNGGGWPSVEIGAVYSVRCAVEINKEGMVAGSLVAVIFSVDNE